MVEASVKIFLHAFRFFSRDKKETSWVLKFRKQHVSLVVRGSDRYLVTASPQNTAHPQVGLRKPSKRLLIQHARGCCVIKLLFSTAISQHQTLAGLAAAWGGTGNPAEEFNPCVLPRSIGSGSPGAWGFRKINLIHPLCPVTPAHTAEKVTYYSRETKEILLLLRKPSWKELTLKRSQRWRSDSKAE